MVDVEAVGVPEQPLKTNATGMMLAATSPATLDTVFPAASAGLPLMHAMKATLPRLWVERKPRLAKLEIGATRSDRSNGLQSGHRPVTLVERIRGTIEGSK